MADEFIYVDNDNFLGVAGLKNPVTNEFVNDAAVTVTVRDGQGNVVDGVTWPAPAPYQAGSNGDYYAMVENMVLSHGQFYEVEIDAEAAGLTAHWAVWRKAIIRRD